MYESGPEAVHGTVLLTDTPNARGVYCGKEGFIIANGSSAHCSLVSVL